MIFGKIIIKITIGYILSKIRILTWKQKRKRKINYESHNVSFFWHISFYFTRSTLNYFLSSAHCKAIISFSIFFLFVIGDVLFEMLWLKSLSLVRTGLYFCSFRTNNFSSNRPTIISRLCIKAYSVVWISKVLNIFYSNSEVRTFLFKETRNI
jgi:hypothetical protein